MKLEEVIPSRYQLGSILADAGQSRVFNSTDLLTNERVVIKYIERKNGALSAGLSEISALFAINHPNIVSCLDFHYLANGACIIIHEFIDGGTLRQYLGDGKVVSVEFWNKCAQDLLQGLSHLHQKNLVHRDLKPENILLKKSPTGGLPNFMIADLGLAQFKKQAARGSREGCGSPAYMAPEAFNGRTSPSSDLYSLGVILYEMAAASRPFNGSIKKLAKSHAYDVPDLDLIELEGIDTFIGQLLAKKPDHRIASSIHALQSLETVNTIQIELQTMPRYEIEEETCKNSRYEKQMRATQALEQYDFIQEFYLDSLARKIIPFEINGEPAIAAVHSNHIELFNGSTGVPLNRFIPKIGDRVQLLSGNQLITSDSSRLYLWRGDYRKPRKIADLGHSTLNTRLAPDANFIIWTEGTRVFFRSLIGNDQLHLAECANSGLAAHFLFPESTDSFVLIPGTAQPLATWFKRSGEICGEATLDGPVISTSHIDLPALLTCPNDSRSKHALSLVFFEDAGQLLTVPIHEVPLFHSFCEDGLVYGNSQGSIMLINQKGEEHHLGETGDLDSIFLFPLKRNFFYSVKQLGHRRKFQLYTHP